MDSAGEKSAIEPVACISEKRLKNAFSILKEGAQHERPPARERLVMLAQELDRILAEIELFSTVVYCAEAAACLLDNYGVLRMLAGSVIYEQGGKRNLPHDRFWNAPSPAAGAVLGRSANGRVEWKDRQGRSINSIVSGQSG